MDCVLGIIRWKGGGRFERGNCVFGVGFWVLEARGGRRGFWVFWCIAGEWNARDWKLEGGLVAGKKVWQFAEGRRRDSGFSLALSIHALK